MPFSLIKRQDSEVATWSTIKQPPVQTIRTKMFTISTWDS